jgi:hypothetical protein
MFQAEIENYPHLVLIICSWWDELNNVRQRDYKTQYDFLQGASVAFSVLGRFELSDEMDVLMSVFDMKLTHKYLQDRKLITDFNRSFQDG